MDSICINLEDAAERSHQVTLMGEVYGCAETVYAWLSPLEEEHSFKRTLSIFDDLAYTRHTWKDPKYSFSSHFDDTRAVFNNEWFQRGWTFQELVLARHLTLLADERTPRAQIGLQWYEICRGIKRDGVFSSAGLYRT